MEQKQRIDNFQGTEAEYISHLEEKVLRLKREVEALSQPPTCEQSVSLLPSHEQSRLLHTQLSSLREHQAIQPVSPSLQHVSLRGPLRSPTPRPPFLRSSTHRQPFSSSRYDQSSPCNEPSSSSLISISPEDWPQSESGNKPLKRGLRIIPFNSDLRKHRETSCIYPPKPKKARTDLPDWQQEMDAVLRQISRADWLARRKELDLYYQNIISLFVQDEAPPLPSSPRLSTSSEIAQVDFEREYIKRTIDMGIDGELRMKISSFGKLVYDSWSYVIVKLGIDTTEVVDPRMKEIHERDLGRKGTLVDTPRTWMRFRKAALWVNELVADLEYELDCRATELLLLYAQQPERYVRFSEAKECATYFKNHVRTLLKTTPELGIQGTVPLSIPFFVKQLARNKCSLSEICETLKYKSTHLTSISFSQQTSLEQPESIQRLLLTQQVEFQASAGNAPSGTTRTSSDSSTTAAVQSSSQKSPANPVLALWEHGVDDFPNFQLFGEPFLEELPFFPLEAQSM